MSPHQLLWERRPWYRYTRANITGTKSDDGCAINYRYGTLHNLRDCIIFIQQNALTKPRCKNVEFPYYYSQGIRQWYQKFAVRIANGIHSWCAHVVRNTGTDIQSDNAFEIKHASSRQEWTGRSGKRKISLRAFTTSCMHLDLRLLPAIAAAI